MKALLIIDIQNDFLPNGALAVPNGDEVIPFINRLSNQFDIVVATQDWHPESHKSFAENPNGKRAFETIMWQGNPQVLWPKHCVQNTVGAAIHADLSLQHMNAIFRKGMNPMIDSYSAFFDNNHLENTGLHGFLKDKKVTDVYVCGLAADYCVYFTAKDAIDLGYKTHFITDATRAIDQNDFKEKQKALEKIGVRFITSDILV